MFTCNWIPKLKLAIGALVWRNRRLWLFSLFRNVSFISVFFWVLLFPHLFGFDNFPHFLLQSFHSFISLYLEIIFVFFVLVFSYLVSSIQAFLAFPFVFFHIMKKDIPSLEIEVLSSVTVILTCFYLILLKFR